MPTSPTAEGSNAAKLSVGDIVVRVRHFAGLYLFFFVVTHYFNHMLGLVSYETMEAGRIWFLTFWRFPPVELLLAAALVSHAGLALWKAARSRTFRLPPWEWAQLLLGISIPFLLAEHILGTRGLSLKDGMNDTYAWVLLALYPNKALVHGFAIFAVWVHACIGIHFWLRLKPWYPPAAPWLLGLAVLWPTLAFLGFVSGGQTVQALAQDRDWVSDLLFEIGFTGMEAAVWVNALSMNAAIGAGVMTFAAASWRTIGWLRAKRRSGVRIQYSDGTNISVAHGVSVLEASWLAGVPHASVCGGRGRCSTCRIRILEGLAKAPKAESGERRVLRRINAPPGVRLACQLRPVADISVAPLLPASASTQDVRSRAAHESGAEREIVIMFADIRAFTKISEGKLPFDVVFLLNQYFRAMGEAIEANGGRLDKFIGDGIMALFGVESGAGSGCRQALAASLAMSEVLDGLNAALANDLERPLRIGIGLQVGPVIVGEMGYRDTTSVTAIGDAVNVASRLETMTKDFKAQMVIANDVFSVAGLPIGGLKTDEVPIRGREQPLNVVVIDGGEDLRPLLEAHEVVE